MVGRESTAELPAIPAGNLQARAISIHTDAPLMGNIPALQPIFIHDGNATLTWPHDDDKKRRKKNKATRKRKY